MLAAAKDFFLELCVTSGFTVWAVTPENVVRLSQQPEFSNWNNMPRALTPFFQEKDACILRGVRLLD